MLIHKAEPMTPPETISLNHPNPPISILYHSPCFDGFGAAYAAWRQFGEGAQYVPCEYNQPLDVSPYAGHRVYLLDYCPNLVALKELVAVAHHVHLIDHHKTAAETIAQLELPHTFEVEKFTYTLDMAYSGAYLAWLRFTNEPIPMLIKHIADRDLWLFSLPGTRPVMAAVGAMGITNFKDFDSLVIAFECKKDYRKSIRKMGEAILKAEAQVIDDHVDKARFAGFLLPGDAFVPAMAVCATMHWSEICEAILLRYPDIPVAATYYFTEEGMVKYSLRSRKGGTDVAAICQQYGGGGHATAAAFKLSLHQFYVSVTGEVAQAWKQEIAEGQV